MITTGWTEIVRCSGCGGAYDIGDAELTCGQCETQFPVVDGIPVLLDDTTTGTSLEEIDYDAVHGINERMIGNIGAQWRQIIEQLELEPEHALEIGAGTGALTLGLLGEKAVERLTATDISHKFLRMLAARAGADPTPVSLVACDANEPHFRSSTFDLVVGNSILHHLLDYDETLRQCHAVLKPGGAAVFFEPVLEGKTTVTLLLALVLRFEEITNGDRLSPADREQIRKQIRHQMKSKLVPLDRQSLAQLEDKYIFEIDQLTKEGSEAGFAEVEVINNGEVDPTYWPYLARTFSVMGIGPEKIEAFKWIGEEFANTYGVMFPDKLVTPMVYFVFHK
ncbi:MAG: methyltransferase domain-containing protein [Acidimicrobiia bacterium]